MSSTPTSELIARLTGVVGDAGLILDAPGKTPFLRDWRDVFHGQAVAVVRPKSTAEVAGVVRICAEFGVAITPHGGGTGLAGGATPLDAPGQIVLALDRMNRVRDLDIVDNVLVAEAGCVLQSLQVAAEEAGRLLPLSFAAEGSAQIGGAIATNAGGVNVLRYGSARQLVLGLEVVLPDGAVLDRLRRLRKDNAGYDLKQMFIGSEGTLGIITAVSLRLFPRPVQTQAAVVAVGGPEAAVELYVRLNAEMGEFLSSFELISAAACKVSLDHLPDANWPFRDGWSVLVEVATSSPEVPLADILEAALGRALEYGCAEDAVIAQTLAQGQGFWRVREGASEGERASGKSVKHDVSIPISRIPALIRAVEAGLAERFPGARPNIFGHVGDGNMHVNVILSPAQANDPQAPERINRFVHDLIAVEGGSITAEHGVGQYRIADLYRYTSPVDMGVMEQLKRMLDPAGLMNPGKVISSAAAVDDGATH